MLFHSWEFFVFYGIVYLLYLNLSHSSQNRMLLLASYYFYGSWDWRYLSLLITSTTVDYFCGLKIQNSNSKKHKKRFVIVSIFVNLSILGIFKYYNFFADNFKALMNSFSLNIHPYFIDVALPLGISFYTFQTISYSIDIYRGKLKAAKNYLDFALYVSFFPQLLIGPIERGTRLLPQILNPRTLSLKNVYRGVYLFLWGLFLKVFMADNLAKIVDPVYNSSGPYDGGQVLLATYAFSFQIYGDFAGYSFMAIGLGCLMGVDLMENFRRPYFSKNISEFWRRWHISLSSWLRDYLYIPLGGNQKGPHRTCINIFITMLIGGLWHGAGWNFAVFGIFHGLMIGFYYYSCRYWDKLGKFVQIFLTYQMVCFGWLIFRATSLDQVCEMFLSIFLHSNDIFSSSFLDQVFAFILLILILLIIQIFQDWKNDTFVVLKCPLFVQYAFMVFLSVLILVFGDFGERPFIYFQF
jgi:alginate O-acetyltransferase complex protein AlgI